MSCLIQPCNTDDALGDDASSSSLDLGDNLLGGGLHLNIDILWPLWIVMNKQRGFVVYNRTLQRYHNTSATNTPPTLLCLKYRIHLGNDPGDRGLLPEGVQPQGAGKDDGQDVEQDDK